METLKKPLILVVDDAPNNIQVVGKILHDKEYNISVAMSGKQALELINAEFPDLIFNS